MTQSLGKLSIQRTFEQADFNHFAALSGDNNPIHVDPEFSARTRFGRTVAHGMLLATVFRGLVDRLVPGSRAVSQALQFWAPTYADEPMQFTATIDGEDDEGTHVSFECRRMDDDVLTCEGSATLKKEQPEP